MVKLKIPRRRLALESLESRALLTFATIDLDADGVVGFSDFLKLSAAFGTNDFHADFDGDFRVGFSDFLILSSNYGASVLEFAEHPYPEPALADPVALTVNTPEEWEALHQLVSPIDPTPDLPVSLEDKTLVFLSMGRTGLGQWVGVEWATRNADHIEVAYRTYIGGVKPPPGTHVSATLFSLSNDGLPITFRQLPDLPLP